jgi:DNA mismatch repair protein MutS
MAQFEIDKQTINDLGLFSADGVSVYSFFNHTQTIGGERKLRQLIETPSFDLSVLESRKKCAKYFYDNKLTLPLNKKDIDFIEHYLAYNSTPLKANIIDAALNKVKNQLSPTNDHYVIKQGINDLHQLLIILNAFNSSEEIADIPLAIGDIKVQLSSFLAIQDIQKLISTHPGNEMGFMKVSYYDNLFRKIEIAAINGLLKSIYELDAYMAIAKAVELHGFCFADYDRSTEPYVKISSLYHPCIKNAVKNDVLIGEGRNLFFLTGANMAGKSSFLKSLGLAVYLAHVGFPVPAKAATISLFKGLITTINLADDINSGYSHYFSEVSRIKQTALKIKEQDNLFVIFDELFRGTNVKDAYDASLATIIALSKIRHSIFLISTHIVEIATELKAFENIAFKYFDSQIDNGKPVFDFKLKEGVSTETLGYFIFKNEGIIAILEQAAMNRIADN